jgi:hypothetical protein
MTPDTDLIHDALRARPVLTLEPRTYRVGGLSLPAGCKLEGAGPGLTVLEVVDGATGILVDRTTGSPATTIRDLTVTTTAFREQGIWVRAPKLFRGNRGHAAELTLEHVEVRGGEHTFHRGMVIEHIVNAYLADVYVVGRWNELTPPAFDDDQAMAIGIDLTGSQEAKINTLYIHGSRIGVYGRVPAAQAPDEAGCGEGHAISYARIINVLLGVRVDGQRAGVNGGFNTPWLTVAHSHIFYLAAGVLAVNYHDVHLVENSYCVSHFHDGKPWKVGSYLVQVANGRVSGNTYWNTGSGASIGILNDRSVNIVTDNNLFDPSTQIPISP